MAVDEFKHVFHKQTFIMNSEIQNTKSTIDLWFDDFLPSNQSRSSLFCSIFPPKAVSDVFVYLFHNAYRDWKSAHKECGEARKH